MECFTKSAVYILNFAISTKRLGWEGPFEKQEQKGHLKGTIQDFLLERWVQIDACQRPLWSVIDPIVFMAQHQ